MNGRSPRAYPVEDFLQSLTAQLDRAQDALALKVNGTNRPLTWALKDLSIDLRVFVDVNERGRVMLRSAGPNEEGASTVHLSLTTITRPMVEENAWSFRGDSDLRSLDELRGAGELDDDDRRKLDMLGVRTVGQLKQMDPQAVNLVAGIPMTRLHAALAASARPSVTGHEVVRDGNSVALKIYGANLSDGVTPEVHLSGEPVEVIEAKSNQLLVRPLEHHDEGQVEVYSGGERATGYYRLGRARYGAKKPKEAAE